MAVETPGTRVWHKALRDALELVDTAGIPLGGRLHDRVIDPAFRPGSRSYMRAMRELGGDTPDPPDPPEPDTLFGSTPPAQVIVNETGNTYTLGLVVQFAVPAVVQAIRWFKGPDDDNAVRTGWLWDGSGAILATVTAPTEGGAGWYDMPLPSPVAVSPGLLYVIGVRAPEPADYTVTPGLGATRIERGVLIMPSSGDLAPLIGNGRFGAGVAEGDVPNQSFNDNVYGVDLAAIAQE